MNLNETLTARNETLLSKFLYNQIQTDRIERAKIYMCASKSRIRWLLSIIH